MGFNNHAQRSTPPYYLDVNNPFFKGVELEQGGLVTNKAAPSSCGEVWGSQAPLGD